MSAHPLTIAVCVKFTVDTDTLQADPVTGAPALARARYRINDFDENGIEAAVQLRNAREGRVLGLSFVARRPPDDLVLHVLAAGVDELYLVGDDGEDGGDAQTTAAVLAAAVRKLGPVDLVVASDTSVDDYRGEIGPRLAEALGMPCVSYATRLAVEDGRLRADRTLEDRVETVEVALPALVTVGAETNQPGLPTLRQVKQAGEKPVFEWSLGDLGDRQALVRDAPRVRTLEIFAPPSERQRVVVEGTDADETARKLLRHLLETSAVKL